MIPVMDRRFAHALETTDVKCLKANPVDKHSIHAVDWPRS